jgi:HEPN domain-containing protein
MVKKQTLKKAIDFWIKAAQDNFQTATAMLKTGHYCFAMFMCQQSLEALLKAIVIMRSKERPPYLHQLGALLKATGLKVPCKILEVLIEADQHYIKTRYKEDRFNSMIYNKNTASLLIKKTEEAMKWFIKKVKLGL